MLTLNEMLQDGKSITLFATPMSSPTVFQPVALATERTILSLPKPDAVILAWFQRPYDSGALCSPFVSTVARHKPGDAPAGVR